MVFYAWRLSPDKRCRSHSCQRRNDGKSSHCTFSKWPSHQRKILSGALPEAETLRIRTDHGIVSLPRNLVVDIDGDLSVKQQLIDPGDYNAQIELILWAIGQDQHDEALRALKKLVRHPQYDLVGKRLRAQLTDRVHGAEAALPHYRRYQNDGGTDPEAIARLQEITRVQEKYRAEIAAYEAAQKGDSQKPTDQQTSTVQEGLEKVGGWRKEAEEFANPTVVSIVPMGTEKDNVLRLLARKGDRGKGALRLRFNPPYDLSGLPILQCAVFTKGSNPLPFRSL